MTDEPDILERVRTILSGQPDVVEKRVTGGSIGFMVGGHPCCSAGPNGLTVRVGPEAREQALAERHVRPLEIGKRQTAAFVVVEAPGWQHDADLEGWIERGLDFFATLD